MTHTIDAGIGKFTANCEENLKLKMFLDSLKDRIEIDGKLDEIISFLDEGCKNKTDTEDEFLETIRELEEQVDDKYLELTELQKELDKSQFENEIGDGIFKIKYNANSLPMQSVMEELEVAINKTNPLKVLEHLQYI